MFGATNMHSFCAPPQSQRTVLCSGPWRVGKQLYGKSCKTAKDRTGYRAIGRCSQTRQQGVRTVRMEAGDLAYGVSSEQGVRDTMEDYVDVKSDFFCSFTYCAVFDGHAGHMAAEYLQEHLSADVKSSMEAEVGICEYAAPGEPIPEHQFGSALTTAFLATDQIMLDLLEKEQSLEGLSGSTATVLLIREDRLVIANVGDSRAVLARNGRAIDLTYEHRLYGKTKTAIAEIKRVKSTGAWVSDGRVMGVLAVSRAFGDIEFKRKMESLLVTGVQDGMWSQKFADKQNITETPVVCTPDIVEMALTPTDEFVIVATDGVWDVLSSAQAAKLVRNNLKESARLKISDPAQTAADALIKDAVHRRKTQDNVAAVVVLLKK